MNRNIKIKYKYSKYFLKKVDHDDLKVQFIYLIITWCCK